MSQILNSNARFIFARHSNSASSPGSSHLALRMMLDEGSRRLLVKACCTFSIAISSPLSVCDTEMSTSFTVRYPGGAKHLLCLRPLVGRELHKPLGAPIIERL